MTIDTFRPGADLAEITSSSVAMERLSRWVEAAGNANRLVAPLVNTPFVPDQYKPRVANNATDDEKHEAYQLAVANATAAVLQGLTLGLDPMTSLQQIIIIHGRPSMYAKMMVALIQSHGHKVWTEEQSDTSVTVAGQRKGSERVERVTITMEQARKAGWTKNDAYGKTPQDMLWARAAGRVCDRIASDVLKGIASTESVRDEPREEKPAAVRVTAAEILGQPAEPELPAGSAPAGAEESGEPALEPAHGPDKATSAQLRMMHALFGKAEMADRADRLQYVNEVLAEGDRERQVESSSDLTKAEAGRVIDKLQSFADQLDPEKD